MIRRPAAALLPVLLPVLLAACAAPVATTGSTAPQPKAEILSSAPAPSRSPSSPAASSVYVAVGASDAFGVGAGTLSAAWPFVFARTAAPRSRVVDLGVPALTTAAALHSTVPAAVALAPTVVTVWLAVDDLVDGVAPAAYERSLDAVVHALRRGGRTTVLVGTVPPLDRLPAYLACRPERPVDGPPCEYYRSAPGAATVDGLVVAYTAAVRRVAAREGAVAVDLAAPLVAARAEGPAAAAALIAPDGFHPSPAGHRAIAAAFAAAYRLAAPAPSR